jgi:hypothetical protein
LVPDLLPLANREIFMNRRIKALLMTGAIASGIISGALASNAGNPEPTFGTVPEFEAGDQLDLARIPDYVSVIGQDGEVAGYVKRDQLFAEGPTPQSPQSLDTVDENGDLSAGFDESLTVYDRSGAPIGRWFHATPSDPGGFRPNDG